MDQSILRQFAYNAWANRRVAASLRTVSGPVDLPLKLLAHILNAERLWLDRILGHPGPLPWDERNIEECDRLINDNHQAYAEFFASTTAQDEWQIIDYRTTDGTPFQTSLHDILQHVLMHGCYHRGQIANRVKAAGGTPVSTDFLIYVREIGSQTGL